MDRNERAKMSYRIMGKLDKRDWEEIDTAKDKEEADYLVQEYRIAFGSHWVITSKKGKK